MNSLQIRQELHGYVPFAKYWQLTSATQKELVKGKPNRRIVVTSFAISMTCDTSAAAISATLYNGDTSGFTNTFRMTPTYQVLSENAVDDNFGWFTFEAEGDSFEEMIENGFITHQGDSLWLDVGLPVGSGTANVMVNGFLVPASQEEVTDPDRYLLF